MTQKRYWLRGGINGVLFITFAWIILSGVLFFLEGRSEELVIVIMIYLYGLPLYPFSFISELVSGSSFSLYSPDFFGLILVIFSYFIIGAFIGYIYGKIKRRKNA
ncbi:MAG: hypothetical protein AAB453_02350 [Patescibacteria group bacterium]